MQKKRLIRVTLLLFTILWTLHSKAAASQKPARWEWEGVGHVVALGDVHGRYDQLVPLLEGTGMMDADHNWTGGKAHLVLCGDLVDRGYGDRPVLDLIMRLQKEAASAGGNVHALLGNHEAMNLVRDFRYVHVSGYAAFSGDERSKDREEAWKGYQESFSEPGIEPAELEAAFQEKHPPGYFGRLRAFSEKGPYGAWLLEQPVVVKVNGIVYIHGGLTPETAALGLDAINRRVKESLRSMMKSIDVLSGFAKTPLSFSELYAFAIQVSEAKKEGKAVNDEAISAAEEIIEQFDAVAFAPAGPLWHRGNSLANERIEREPMGQVLESLNARALMVGHTVTRTGRISRRYNGRLYRGDVGMGYGRPGRALILEEDNVEVFELPSRSASTPFDEPPYGEGYSKGYVHLPDIQLEKALGEARVIQRTEVSSDDRTAEIWELENEELKLRVVFRDIEDEPSERARRYQHEYAAYWLDRKLGLGFVPVVVIRDVDGRSGALRSVLETAVDLVSIRSILDLEEATRAQIIQAVAGHYGVDADDLKEQVIRARAFEALIGNRERQDYARLFIPAEGRLALVDHERAFIPSPEIPAEILDGCGPMPPDMEVVLKSLDKEELEKGLGDYLSDAQIEALLERRDKVLEVCGAPDPDP
jgi:hypothetical protein